MQGMAGILPLILLLLIMYFLLIRPQKKREKQINAMRSSIQVGDEIITIGGICGKVVKTKEETLVIQVGADKTKFEVMRWSISKVVNEKEEAVKETKKEEETPKKSGVTLEVIDSAQADAAPAKPQTKPNSNHKPSLELVE